MPASQRTLERRIRAVYEEAQGDLRKKLDAYIARFREKDARKRKDLSDGKITQQQYDDWRQGAIFQGKAWRARLKQVTDTLADANEESLRLVRGEQLNEFAEGMNHEQFVLEQNTGISVNFGIYDADTVGTLIREQPDLLPPKKLNRGKDSAWNQKKVTGSVLQGIIQGESIDDIARRIARDTSQQNSKAMIRYARTATTGAQNAGRMETMHRAQGMGINVRKQWLATLDGRTRDSHRHLDGQVKDIDDYFDSDYGKIMFPGDPSAHPGDVYNCRCTLVYVYPDYPTDAGKRLDNVTGEHVRGDITYDEWAGTQPKAQPETKPAAARPRLETIEEAEAYAKSTFVDTNMWGSQGLSLEGISVDSANIVVGRLAEFYETYDVDKFSTLVAPAGNTKLGKAISGAHAGFNPMNRAMILNRKSLKDPEKVREALAKERELVADYLKNPDKYPRLSAYTRKLLEASRKSGRATVPTSLEEAIDHECGHALEKALSKAPNYHAVEENMPKYADGISGYATTSMSEYIAESHCAWRRGEECVDPEMVKAFEWLRRGRK